MHGAHSAFASQRQDAMTVAQGVSSVEDEVCGPALNGLDGRKAGTVEGYDYSEVNRNSEAVQGVP